MQNLIFGLFGLILLECVLFCQTMWKAYFGVIQAYFLKNNPLLSLNKA
jgi:hypothetical protein